MNKNELLAEVKRKGLTQEQVAKVIGIHGVTLNKKINGQSQFTLSEINDIVNLLDIPDDRIRAIFFNAKVE